ncbi:MAG TPA: cupin domain-containing protein [Kiloniellales bacterium]|nr:cupin domain-containing protein [Kiloniellales bacterium]
MPDDQSPATPQRFTISRAEDAVFDPKGLRSFFAYRDLGIAAATGGQFHAHVIRAREACRDGTGRHRHGLAFQMFYVLRGEVSFWYEGKGEFTFRPGDAVLQPPGIAHELLRCSGDCEILEITSPADFATDPA